MVTTDRESMVLPPNNQPKSTTIYAAQKIIADISSGLYRSPAAALKELVANGYDADATEVTITTDAPYFRTLVIQDNGTGMSMQDFLRVLKHIGGSRKRIDRDITLEKHRQLIGRIGIGMLAVAQLGYRFYVTSSVKGEPWRFIAEVDLSPFHKDDAALKSMGRFNDDDQVELGAVKYVDKIPEDKDVHYTVITVPDAKKGLISELTGVVRDAVGYQEKVSVENPLRSFKELIHAVYTAQRADAEFDGYYYLLWELALLCPVNYIDQGPDGNQGPFERMHFGPERDRVIEGVQEIKVPEINDFKVVVDGIELSRPQLFPNPSAYDYSSPNPKAYPIEYDRNVAGRRLKFFGYIYTQQPRIDPEEYRGVHIRIRNVGIGRYDRSWLGYPFNEGLKFGQVTGEIYVEDGLEAALNIDRDSFRETDVHYQALRAHLWEKLRKEVFPDFKARQKLYSASRKSQQQEAAVQRFNDLLLQLPAPLVEDVQVSNDITPELSTWIGTTGTALRLHKTRWEQFAIDNGLSGRDAKERFTRVLKVLMSNELLADMDQDEAELLLRALANAVQ